MFSILFKEKLMTVLESVSYAQEADLSDNVPNKCWTSSTNCKLITIFNFSYHIVGYVSNKPTV